jgi:hypothetical protein
LRFILKPSHNNHQQQQPVDDVLVVVGAAGSQLGLPECNFVQHNPAFFLILSNFVI